MRKTTWNMRGRIWLTIEGRNQHIKICIKYYLIVKSISHVSNGSTHNENKTLFVHTFSLFQRLNTAEKNTTKGDNNKIYILIFIHFSFNTFQNTSMFMHSNNYISDQWWCTGLKQLLETILALEKLILYFKKEETEEEKSTPFTLFFSWMFSSEKQKK